MRTSHLVAGLLATITFASVAVAQNAPQQAPQRAPAADTVPMKHPGYWRASKLVGVDVYNNANEKIGDINEVLLDPSGKIAGLVIGVGGFLGMGEHDVMVKPGEIRFVNEPMRSASPPPRAGANNRTANTSGAGTSPNDRAVDEKWYPDHAVMNATKDQLKAMPEFKYSNYN